MTVYFDDGSIISEAQGIFTGTIPQPAAPVVVEYFDDVMGFIDGTTEFADGVIDAAPSVLFNGLVDGDRGLTQDEIDALRPIFGDSIDYGSVRVDEHSELVAANGALPGNGRARPFVTGNTINAAGPLTIDDLVHEMTHIWQFQTGGPGYARALFNPDYDYSTIDLEAHAGDPLGSRLDNFELEEQGEIVKDYYLLREQLTESGLTPTEESEIRAQLEIYQPYIDEIKDTRPREGADAEANEWFDEVAREGTNIPGEFIQSGGAPRELLEGGLQVGWEIFEGGAETGGAWASERIEGALDPVADEFDRRMGDAIASVWRRG